MSKYAHENLFYSTNNLTPVNHSTDAERRVFIKGLGFVSLGLLSSTMLGGCETIRENIRNRPTRRRLRSGSTAVNNDIAIYQDAVAQMKALPANNPRSWAAQSAIHGTVNGGFNFCQHGTDHFFSWHRAYLFYFEKICCALTGEDDFALPYWNWNQNPGIHSAFLDPASSLFDGTRINTSVAGNSAFTAMELDPMFNDSNFFTFGSQIEGTPHDMTHIIVRGNMITGGSPLDPVFYAHHNMVDYCWAKWNIELENDTTNESGWLNTSWNHFVDGNGDPVEVTAGATTLMPLLNYQYETSAIGGHPAGRSISAKSADEFRRLENRLKKGAEVRLEVKQRIPIGRGARVRLNQPMSLNSRVSASDFASLANVDKRRERLLVRVKYAQAPSVNDFFVRVFINLPTASSETSSESPHYAGSFAFFGTHKQGQHGIHNHKTEYLVNATNTLNRLKSNGLLRDGDEISVQLVAVPVTPSSQFRRPGAQLDVEEIELLVSPVTIKSK